MYVKECKIETEIPTCDNTNFILLDIPDSIFPAVICWYSGDNEYEEQICGIIIKKHIDNEWKTVFSKNQNSIGAEYLILNDKKQNELSFTAINGIFSEMKFCIKLLYKTGEFILLNDN